MVNKPGASDLVSSAFLGRKKPRIARREKPGDFFPVGLEIEVEQFILRDAGAVPPRWAFTHDGSLRNNGIEFLNDVPLYTPTHAARKITEICDYLTRNNAATSIRTGIHVHVNMQDVPVNHVFNILLAYCLVEPALYAFCGADRANNPYCIPWYDAHNSALAYAQFMSNPTSPRYKRRVTSSNKYAGLYLGPLARFGTIEFRHLPTTLDAERIIAWVDHIQRLCNLGESTDYSALVQDVDLEELAHHAIAEVGLAEYREVYDDVDIGSCIYKLLPWMLPKVEPSMWIMVNAQPKMKKRKKRKTIDDLLREGRVAARGARDRRAEEQQAQLNAALNRYRQFTAEYTTTGADLFTNTTNVTTGGDE